MLFEISNDSTVALIGLVRVPREGLGERLHVHLLVLGPVHQQRDDLGQPALLRADLGLVVPLACVRAYSVKPRCSS